jgi:hypothetical protein
MPQFVSCPSCEGLLPSGRESCPHCDFRPAAIAQVALGAAALVGFSAFIACCGSAPVVEYGPCVQPNGQLCGDESPDASDGGGDATVHSGDSGEVG